MCGFVMGIFIGIWSGPVGLLAGLIPGALIGLVTGVALSAAPVRVYQEIREKRSPAAQTVRVQSAVTAAMASVPVLAYVFTVEFISSSEFARRAVTVAVAPVIGAVWGAATSNLYPWVSHRLAGFWAIAFGLLPRRLGAFLEHVDERIIMRRTSGGYQFLHLTLQDYLASSWTRQRRTPWSRHAMSAAVERSARGRRSRRPGVA
jgi:hypothetical protein